MGTHNQFWQFQRIGWCYDRGEARIQFHLFDQCLDALTLDNTEDLASAVSDFFNCAKYIFVSKSYRLLSSPVKCSLWSVAVFFVSSPISFSNSTSWTSALMPHSSAYAFRTVASLSLTATSLLRRLFLFASNFWSCWIIASSMTGGFNTVFLQFCR